MESKQNFIFVFVQLFIYSSVGEKHIGAPKMCNYKERKFVYISQKNSVFPSFREFNSVQKGRGLFPLLLFDETQIFLKIKHDLMRPVLCYEEVLSFLKRRNLFIKYNLDLRSYGQLLSFFLFQFSALH